MSIMHPAVGSDILVNVLRVIEEIILGSMNPFTRYIRHEESPDLSSVLRSSPTVLSSDATRLTQPWETKSSEITVSAFRVNMPVFFLANDTTLWKFH
jgi:hypothetical protein